MRFPVLVILLRFTLASAQTPLQRAEAAFKELQAWYNTTSGIWDTCGWWNGANCMTVIANLATVDASITNDATSIFANTYKQAPSVNPAPQVYKTDSPNGIEETHYGNGWPSRPSHSISPQEQKTQAVIPASWLDGYYDDNAWWALAWIAAYDVTQTEAYLSLATQIFEDMTHGWPTNCSNGGIWWNSNHTYVNAIANELFLSVAGHLANRVPANTSYYVDWAQKELNWFTASGMIDDEGNINDGLTKDCKNNQQQVWSYNQGVILGGLVELNKAAPNSSYLHLANSIASAAIKNLTDADHVLHDRCEPHCAPDGTQFKGIFIRNLAQLNAVSPSAQYAEVINASATSIWANDRKTNNNSLSVDWSGPFAAPVNASTHSSAMDALVAALGIDQS